MVGSTSTETRSKRAKTTTESSDNGENLTAAILEIIKSEDFMVSLTQLITNAVSKQIDIAVNKHLVEIEALKKENNILKAEMKKINIKQEYTEMYSRRNNLRFMGVPENLKENTDNVVLKIINENLGLQNISLSDLERAQRIGIKKGGKIRVIIVRFANYRVRQLVFSTKARLKGSKMLIKEDLTADRLARYQKACENFHYKNVWTLDGTIFIKCGNTVYKIEREESLEDLIKKKGKQDEDKPGQGSSDETRE